MAERICPKCDKPELRAHRHDRDNALVARIGRFNAEQERSLIRTLLNDQIRQK